MQSEHGGGSKFTVSSVACPLTKRARQMWGCESCEIVFASR
jgi:hypothetical protein